MKTTAQTVAMTLTSLLNDHVEHHDPEIPHVMGMRDGSEANIAECTEIKSMTPGVRLVLSDGSKFRIEVHAI